MQHIDLFRKFQPPSLPVPTLHRSHLLSNLRTAIVGEIERNTHSSRRKRILLCAPAGYGKTTLLADFAVSIGLPCCWYFLDEIDTDVALFLHTLLADLRHVFPQLDQTLEAAFVELFTRETPLSPLFPSLYRSAIDLLCSSLERDVPESFALFLCNYERVGESPQVVDLIDYLLTKLPSQVALIIESRAYPRVELPSLMIHDELFLLNSDALRFSAQEIFLLAQLSGLATITTTRAEQLATFFDGWITGILLTTDLVDLRDTPPYQHSSTGWETLLSEEQTSITVQRDLFTYIVDDVFQRQPALFHFLQSTAVLQYLEAEICNALLDITDSASLLAHLEELGLFVSSHGNHQQIIYTCHPAMRSLLNTQLHHQDARRFSMLHRHAAEVWLACQNYEQTMYHLFQIHDYELAMQIIFDSYQHLLIRGNWDTLRSWLSALPPSLKEKRPHLLLLEANIALISGLQADAFALLEKTSAFAALLPAKEGDQIHRLQLKIDLLQGRALYQAEDYLQALTICQHVLQQLTDQKDCLRIMALTLLHLCTICLGDCATGIPHLQAILHQGDSRLSPHQIAEIHEVLATAYVWTSNFVLAEHHLLQALKYYEQLQDPRGIVNALLCKGTFARERGAYPEAETLFQKALELTRTLDFARGREAYVLAQLGRLSLEQRMYTQALTFYEDGLQRAHQSEYHSLTHSILAHLSMVYLFLGDAASAHLFLNQTNMQRAGAQRTSAERREYALVSGLLLLYQGRYDEAFLHLQEAARSARSAGQERELQVAHLRLAACQLARKYHGEALALLQEVMFWLEQHPSAQQMMLVELQWLPSLQQMVKDQPQLLPVQTLQLEETTQLQPGSASDSLTAAPIPEPAVPELTIRAFGEPVVLLNGQIIKNWRMARAMELFFLLLHARHPLSKEQIMTELWPHFDTQVNQTFHSTLHQLRKLMGRSILIFQNGGYSLRLAEYYGTQISYDVQIFQICLAKAEEALKQGDEGAARSELLQAIDLYRGDYVLSFYSNWCIAPRQTLRTAYLGARRQLAQIAWRREAFTEGVEHWQQMLQVDGCLEEAHLGLMQCYARSGQRSLALRQYQACQEILQQELGVEPELEIQQLYRLLMNAPVLRKKHQWNTESEESVLKKMN